MSDTNDDIFDRTIEAAREIMRKNLAGNVVKLYDGISDETVWMFGPHKFRRLRDTRTGKPFPDDPTPFVLGREEVPLEEFRAYLKSWYWPKQKSGEARQPDV